MTKTATNYILESIYIIKDHYIYILPPILISIGLFLTPYLSGDIQKYFIVIMTMTNFLIFPMIYGQYFEIFYNGKALDWGSIYKKHWTKIIIVSIILGIPRIFLSFSNPSIYPLKQIAQSSVIISTMYVLPLTLMRERIFNSITLGIKCLFGNFRYSIPLCVVLLIPIILSNGGYYFGFYRGSFLSYIFTLTLSILLYIANLVVFIAAGMILKVKLS